jgi:Coenzyme PQQ synthesis protein D (PqqD).
MKIKSGFMLRQIADTWVVVPLGERIVEFNGLISLSETGALLWKKLALGAEEQDLIDALLQEYDVDETTAREDSLEFMKSIQEKGLLES